MRRIVRLLGCLLGGLLLSMAAMGEESIRWQPTLESAKRLAVQTDRLVLIHFWADWCQPCRIMNREVFTQPDVISTLETYYVAVKINADFFPATSKQYGVNRLPVDVIITPQGQQIEKIQGLTAAPQYAASLHRVAMAAKQVGPPSYAASYAGGPGMPPVAMPGPASSPPSVSGPPPSGSPVPPYGPYANNYNRPPAVAGPMSVPGSAPPPAAQPPVGPPQQPRQQPPPLAKASPQTAGAGLKLPRGNPPLALDGHCPVQLCDDMKAGRQKWTLGDVRWGARHRGRTYLFSSAEQQRRFLADPDGFAPVLSGNDVVLAFEQGRTISGHREQGILFEGRIYLFADEASLQQFSRKPKDYANWALRTMQVGSAPMKRRLQ